MPPLIAPGWPVVALVVFGASACVLWTFKLRFCSYHQSRWIVSATLGAALAAISAPSPWIGAFVLCLALSIPLSLAALEHRWTIALADPMQGAATLVLVSVWTVGLGLLTASLRATGVVVFLALLLAIMVIGNGIGVVQVTHGIRRLVYRDAGFGPPGTVMRIPTGFLMNTWKPAAINAMLVPVALILVGHGTGWVALVSAAFLGTALWHLWYEGGLTCRVGAAVGALTVLLAQGHLLFGSVLAPLALVAYPTVRRDLLENTRWEAWAIAWRFIRRHRGLGIGIGGWQGLRVQTPKEGERLWMHAHNEWLETLLECGPLPVLCATAYLGLVVARLLASPTPLQVGVAGSLIALTVVSLGYMPWRTWPVNLFGLCMLASWEALGG